MGKRLFLLLCTAALSFGSAYGYTDAIYAWVEGGETCYKLSSYPRVVYSSDGKSAQLFVGDNTAPSVSVNLSEGKKLKITFGEYDETKSSVKDAEAGNGKVSMSGKYIYGGHLIIVGRDGRLYNAKGQIIENRIPNIIK